MNLNFRSLACILYEVRVGSPLFCGTDEADQLGVICELLGQPTKELMLSSRKTNFYNAELGIIYMGTRRDGKPRKSGGLSFDKLFPRQRDKTFKIFLSSILIWDANQRPTPIMSANDQWVQENDDI